MGELNPWKVAPYSLDKLRLLASLAGVHSTKRLLATIDAMIQEDKNLESLLNLEGIMRITTAAKLSAAPAMALRAMYEGGIPTAMLGGNLLVVRARDVMQWEAARAARVFDGRRPEVKEEETNAFRNADLSWVPERTRLMIEMRYGLNGSRIHTLESIGQKFNVSRERVRQIIQGVRDRLLIRLLQARGEAKCET
jgi:hypothetical protein